MGAPETGVGVSWTVAGPQPPAVASLVTPSLCSALASGSLSLSLSFSFSLSPPGLPLPRCLSYLSFWSTPLCSVSLWVFVGCLVCAPSFFSRLLPSFTPSPSTPPPALSVCGSDGPALPSLPPYLSWGLSLHSSGLWAVPCWAGLSVSHSLELSCLWSVFSLGLPQLLFAPDSPPACLPCSSCLSQAPPWPWSPSP